MTFSIFQQRTANTLLFSITWVEWRLSR